MTGAEVLDIARDGIWVMIMLSAPMMIVGLSSASSSPCSRR